MAGRERQQPGMARGSHVTRQRHGGCGPGIETTMDSQPEASSSRSTDSDVRCSLLLAAIRAFQQNADASAAQQSEPDLLAQFAEPIILPDALRRS
jgi:hypothetical protein